MFRKHNPIFCPQRTELAQENLIRQRHHYGSSLSKLFSVQQGSKRTSCKADTPNERLGFPIRNDCNHNVEPTQLRWQFLCAKKVPAAGDKLADVRAQCNIRAFRLGEHWLSIYELDYLIILLSDAARPSTVPHGEFEFTPVSVSSPFSHNFA